MTLQLHEYRFGKRGVLRTGDLFRARRGPFFRSTDVRGQKLRQSLARPGVYRFRSYVVSRQRGWINAFHLDRQTYETLYVTGRTFRSPTIAGVVNRPYKIRAVRRNRSND
jgi:hypothetical protein